MAESQVEQIKQKIDIVEVIGERVNLKRAGRNLKGLCPFHSEKTPSFFVTPEMQSFKCFGCGVGGDVFTFLQQYEGLTFPEALEMLAKRAGVTLIKTYRNDEDNKRERGLEILHLAAEYYAYLLMNHPVGEGARKYLANRGVTRESIRDFGLGYSAESWDGLINFLVKKKGYKQEELEAVGMVIGRNGGGYYDRFRGRIMFPQKTATGQVVGFSGRVLDPETKEAKYINTPETAWYHKGEILYGLSIARSSVREKDRVVIVEGELDVISSRQAGVKEVVAVKGSALTEGQINLIRRLTHNLILSLDADKAGQEAIRRAIELGEPAGLNLRVLQLTGGKDPDEIAKNDRSRWKQLVETGVSVYQFYLDTAFSRFDTKTGEGQKKISQFLVPVFSKIENGVEKSFWIKQMAQRLGVEVEVIDEEIRKLRLMGKPSQAKVTEKPDDKKLLRRERLERYVLATLLHLDEAVGEQLKQLDMNWFSEDYLKKFGEALMMASEKTGSSDGGVILKHLGEAQKQLAMELYNEDKALFNGIDRGVEIFTQSRKDLEKLALREKMKRLNSLMTKDLVDEAEKQKIQAEYQELERVLRQDSE
jgi:DNA primase